ncbi:MAG: hypothetical protein LAO31_19925 [Acidobacteriia bacterium]|nr:hypothetical protein [Terriglobia bacterium]
MTETELAGRLERLERDYRRLKRLVIAALVLIAALGTIAATQPVAQTITAHEFHVLDSSGKVRMTMDAGPSGPLLRFYDAQDHLGAQMGISPDGQSHLELSDKKMAGYLQMGVESDGSPLIRLRNVQGFRMDLGYTALVNTRTGASQETSAASIVMFSNDKKGSVIWRAP